MASSAIGFSFVFNGDTGPEGPIGARGPTGNTGGADGATGPVGPYAPNIVDITVDGLTATILFSDDSTLEVSGDFMGATGIDYGIVNVSDPLNPDTDVTTHSLLSSGRLTSSFVVRGISGTGSLVVTEDEDAIYIDSIYTPSSGSLDSTGLTDNTLVYLKKSSQMSSTTIGITSGDYYDGVLNFEKSGSSPSTPSFSNLLARSKVKYIPPTYKTETPTPVTLNVNDAGVFYIRTPNGISAFGGNFKPNEVTSFSIITESDDIWHFPSNVYFQNGENYLTCGKSILNLTTFDQGTSWYATVSARGVDASETNCSVRSLLGSCCYRGPTGQLCADYVTRSQCDILSGTFNPLTPCDVSCGTTLGVCCSNGQCIENTNYAECLAFGGKFLFGVTCGAFGATDSGDNTQRLCYDGCQNQKVACCKDGQCLGDEFTVIECREILGGVPFAGQPCSSVDCCEQNTKEGACCDIFGGCSQKTLIECKNSSGIFMGEGQLCGSVNCECFKTQLRLGYCCFCNGNFPSCKITLEENCPTAFWTFDETLTEPTDSPDTCGGNNAICLDSIGDNCLTLQKCCFCSNGSTTCNENIDQATCTQLGGIYTAGTSCSGAGSISCDNCTSSNGGPCGDCIDLGRCCECVGGSTRCRNDVPQANCNGTWDTDNAPCNENPCNEECPPPASCGSCSTTQQGIILCDVEEPNINDDRDLLSNTVSVNVAENFSYPKQLFNTLNVMAKLPFEFENSAGTPGGNRLAFFPTQKAFDFIIPKEAKTPSGEDIIKIDQNGTGRICITLEFNAKDPGFSTQINSARFYLLRTWYPNHYGINKAAFEGITQESGVVYDFVDPTTDTDETEFSFKYTDSSSNTVDTRFIARKLPNGNLERFYPNTRLLRDELNGPLYGYRGTFGTSPNLEEFVNNSGIPTRPNFTSNTSNFDTFYRHLGLNINKKINYTFGANSTASLFNNFTQLTNIKNSNFNYIKYETSLDALNSSDAVKVYKKYHNSVVDSIPEDTLTCIADNGNVTIPFGYCDGGYAKNYTTNSPIVGKTENSKYRYYAISSFGFANTFISFADLSSLPVEFQADPLFNNSKISPGHPFITDLINQDVTFKSVSGPGSGTDTYKDKNYKTREESIIFDSGILTSDGRIFRDIIHGLELEDSFTFNAGLSGYVPIDVGDNDTSSVKLIRSNAVNDYYGYRPESSTSPTTPRGLIRRTSVRDTSSPKQQKYSFCITIPNIKDYMLPEDYDFTNDSDLDYVSTGTDVDLRLITIERKRRLFENVLRGVLFLDVDSQKNGQLATERDITTNIKINFGANGNTCSLDAQGNDFVTTVTEGVCDLCEFVPRNQVYPTWAIIQIPQGIYNKSEDCVTSDGLDCFPDCTNNGDCCNISHGTSIAGNTCLILQQCSDDSGGCRVKVAEVSTPFTESGASIVQGCFRNLYRGLDADKLAELLGVPVNASFGLGRFNSYAIPIIPGFTDAGDLWPMLSNPDIGPIITRLLLGDLVLCDAQGLGNCPLTQGFATKFNPGGSRELIDFSCLNEQKFVDTQTPICDMTDVFETQQNPNLPFPLKFVDGLASGIPFANILSVGLLQSGFQDLQYQNRRAYYTPLDNLTAEDSVEFHLFSKRGDGGNGICEDCLPFPPNNFTSISVGGICQQIDCNASVENARLCANNTRCPE